MQTSVINVFSTELTPFIGEEFRSVVGYDGFYSISNFGRVKSESRERNNGGIIKERILKIPITTDGHSGICLFKDGKPKHFSISNLVADAFIPKSRDGKKIVVIHKDKDARNNRLQNLMVDTKSISNKMDFDLGLTQNNIDAMALSAIERGKSRVFEFSIFDGGNLIGHVCRRCFKDCSLNEYRGNNRICNNCKSISEGVFDVGKMEKRKDFAKAQLQECSRCKKIKPYKDFYNDKANKNGIVSSCKSCWSKAIKNPQRRNAGGTYKP